QEDIKTETVADIVQPLEKRVDNLVLPSLRQANRELRRASISIRTYAVNCNDAWLNTEGDDISGSYVKYKDHQEVVAALEAKCAALAAENAALKQSEKEFNNFCRQEYYGWEDNFTETPATDAFLAEVRAVAFDELRAAFVRHAKVAELDDADTVTPKEVMDALLHCVEQLRAPE
ncbi:DUF1627 domain-containing protein, partial [Escherichia coli]|uniref:DUF1627 domain-containing protein n=1 Tax=Escherichia coli TaxID=562 RepID=UPI0015EE41C4